MENEELDAERARVQSTAADLHTLNVRQGNYMSEARVHRWGTTEPSRGPRFYRALRRQHYDHIGWCPVFYMDPPINHVAMIDTGQITLWRQDLNRFEQFDFSTGSDIDFRVVQGVVDKWSFLFRHRKS